MNQEVENIIVSKSYQDLDEVDFELIQEFVDSEAEYNTMRKILLTAPTIGEELRPDEALKEDLTALFNQHHESKSRKAVLWWKNPYLISAAAMFILFFAVYPLVSKDGILEENAPKQFAKNEVESELILPEPKEESKTEAAQTEPAQEFDAEIEGTTNSKAEMEVMENTPNPSNEMELADEMAEENVVQPSVAITDNFVSVQMDSISVAFTNAASADLNAVQFNATFNHPDILTDGVVLTSNKQLVQTKPDVLDLLYTSF